MLEYDFEGICDEEVEACIILMNLFKPYKKNYFEALG